jgi:hypothetical protein
MMASDNIAVIINIGWIVDIDSSHNAHENVTSSEDAREAVIEAIKIREVENTSIMLKFSDILKERDFEMNNFYSTSTNVYL